MLVKEGRIIVSYSKPAMFGIAIFLLFSIASLGNVFAETVAKSTNFEKTTLIEYTNNEGVPIKTVRMWLGQDDGAFKSFKTEKGWTGTRTAQGLLVFTADKPLSPGQSVKFGIKTEIANPGINWRTLDPNNNELTIGRTEAGEQPKTSPPTGTTPKQDTTPPPPTNFDNAVFRIIPESPKNGDSIRIMGDGFPPNTSLDFFIDNEKLEDFASDGSGHVIGRAKIPVNKEADRVEFSLVDNQGNKKTVSIRITSAETQIFSPQTTKFTITQFPELVEPGQTVRVSGTAKPGSTVAISYKDASGVKIQEAAVLVDTQGNWAYERVIPPDAELGTRMVEFTDGTDKIIKTLSVSVSKTIHVTASATRYEPGETILLNGTASSDQPVEIMIQDPIGKEIFFDILKMNGTSTIDFEFPTEQTFLKGTYVILLTQDGDTEILRVGLGVNPTEQLVAKFDKLNYVVSEKPKLTITGPAKASVTILIVDPSDRAKITDNISLGLAGNAVYELDLTGYKSGVYTAALNYLQSEINVVFTVGLQYGSGEIKVQATKQTYQLGDAVLVLGSTQQPNVLLTLQMIDPDGNIIKRKDTFTDKEGRFSDGTFRIPTNAEQGTWKIKAISGANLAEVPLKVVGTITQGFVVHVDKLTYQVGDTMTITGTGAGKSQTAIITIYDSKDTEIAELTVITTDSGGFQPFWIVPSDTAPGDYKVKAKVGNEIAETTFKIQ